jgi:hypothetical protein
MQANLTNADKVSMPASTPIDISKLRDAKLETSPYEYLIASGFIRPEWQETLLSEYPVLKDGGSFPLPSVTYGASFAALIESLNGDDFRKAVEEKFSIDLSSKPTMFTVRGMCRPKDGKVHTDSESKIITVLLYMNPVWENQGGRLRVLRSNDLDDVAHEVSPDIGTLLVFKRSNHSWHGHLPFSGTRRVIQMNWVTDQKYVDHEQKRHGWSSFLKRLGGY